MGFRLRFSPTNQSSEFRLFLLDMSRCEEHRKLETLKVKVKGWDEVAGDPMNVLGLWYPLVNIQ